MEAAIIMPRARARSLVFLLPILLVAMVLPFVDATVWAAAPKPRLLRRRPPIPAAVKRTSRSRRSTPSPCSA